MEDQNKITYFGETDFRNKKTPFGIKALDRSRHVYVIGKTGMGKSTLLENMAAQDIQSGNGVAFIDPHGSAVETLLDYVPENRIDDVIYFSPADVDFPVSFNVMENVDPEKRHLVAQGLLSSFKKIWGEDTFSDRMEHITGNTLLALLEYPGATMLSIPRMFVDTKFQKEVISYITDPSVKAFWTKEYKSWDERYRKDAYSAVLNKVGQFTSNPIIRNIVGQSKSSFDFRDVMDTKKILLVNLSVGQVGEMNANLLGSMMTTKIFLAAMSRADASKAELSQLPNFYLFIDEFQNLANDSFADILSQARKYKLNLTMAHQYIEQMPEKVSAAVFGNVGTMIVFRVGSFDAEIFEKEFSPTFYMDDIVNLGIYQIYLKLMIDGVGSSPFSATTLPPIKVPDLSFKEEIFEASRKNFAGSRDGIEKEIKEWHEESKDEKSTVKTSERKPITRTAPRSNERKAPSITKPVQNRAYNNESKNYKNQEIKKYDNKEQKPVLEGNSSLKEALIGAMNTVEIQPENKEKKESIIKKQNIINKDILTENQNKLREALEKATQEAEEEKKEEIREVPESILKQVLRDD